METVGEHTVRCPKCSSDEYLTYAKAISANGEKFYIRTCNECRAVYKVKTEKEA